MITANSILQIFEDYSSLMQGRSEKYPIFINPMNSDYIELNKFVRNFGLSSHRKVEEIRFVPDFKHKKVYVSDAYFAMHDELAKAAGLKRYFAGSAEIRNGQKPLVWGAEGYPEEFDDYFFDGSHQYDNKKIFNSPEMLWLSQYFDLSYLKNKGYPNIS